MQVRLRDVLTDAGMIEAAEEFTADFHMHSCVSDGSCTDAELVAQARERGVSHLAVTNHDTTRGVNAAVEAGACGGVRVWGGVEISAYDPNRGRKVHIVGLGMKEHSPAVEQLCADTLAARHANTLWQLDRLVEAGKALNVAEFKRLSARSTCAYKQHLMAALTGAPFNSAEYKGLYTSLFKGQGICARDISYPDARDAVRAVVSDGGLPVLAHPGQTDTWEFVPALVACGLAGIEVVHPDHDARDEARAAQMADEYGLFCSGGSDYHGRFGAPPYVGCCSVCG